MAFDLSKLVTLIPLLAALLDAVAGLGTAFGWFTLTPGERTAVLTVLGAGFPLLIAVWTIVSGWVHTSHIKAGNFQPGTFH